MPGEKSGEKVIEEKTLSIDDYLKLFSEGSADFEMVKKQSDKLKAITLIKIEGGDGNLYEDTIFIEKSGIQYTVRARL